MGKCNTSIDYKIIKKVINSVFLISFLTEVIYYRDSVKVKKVVNVEKTATLFQILI